MSQVAVTFRAERALAAAAEQLAAAHGLSKSDYLRQALEEKNQRMLAGRIAFLSHALRERFDAEAHGMDATAGDGLA